MSSQEIGRFIDLARFSSLVSARSCSFFRSVVSGKILGNELKKQMKEEEEKNQFAIQSIKMPRPYHTINLNLQTRNIILTFLFIS